MTYAGYTFISRKIWGPQVDELYLLHNSEYCWYSTWTVQEAECHTRFESFFPCLSGTFNNIAKNDLLLINTELAQRTLFTFAHILKDLQAHRRPKKGIQTRIAIAHWLTSVLIAFSDEHWPYIFEFLLRKYWWCSERLTENAPTCLSDEMNTTSKGLSAFLAASYSLARTGVNCLQGGHLQCQVSIYQHGINVKLQPFHLPSWLYHYTIILAAHFGSLW